VVRAQFQGALWTFGLSLLCMAGSSGCQPVDPLQRAGIALAVPGSWKRVEPSTWMVPGTPLAAWSGPEGSSLAVYRALPFPGGSAAMIAEGLANRLTNLPGLQVLVKGTAEIAGQSAARIEVVAPGTGAAFAPSGAGSPIALDDRPLFPTRQVTLGFPRSGGTLFLSWHMPESAHPRIAPEIEAALGSLKLSTDDRTPSHSY
jgi:hypothetical protein